MAEHRAVVYCPLDAAPEPYAFEVARANAFDVTAVVAVDREKWRWRVLLAGIFLDFRADNIDGGFTVLEQPGLL
jgi:hypothetical protein